MPEPEHTPEDELAVMKANIDQNLMLAPEVARVAWTFYSEFVKVGFTPDQAMALTFDQLN